MPYQQVDDGVSLYYEDVGQGPPIVFVHGFGMSHAVWESQVQELCDSFRCITLDLRGHGISDKPGEGYDITQNASDVANLITGLELQQPAFVGWSLGVAIAFQLVGDYGNICSKMVLVGGTPCWGRLPDFPHGHEQAAVAGWIEEILKNRIQWAEGFVRGIFHTEPNPATLRWLWNQAIQVPMHATMKTIEDSRHRDLRPYLAKFDCPTAIFHGRHDQLDFIEAAQYVADAIAGSQMVIFENSGHAPFFEERERFNAELRQFLT